MRNDGLKTMIYPVEDLTKAKAVFSALLGSDPVVDEPYYVGYQLGEQHIGLDPNGRQQGMAGPLGFYHVGDLAEAVQALVAAGAEVRQEIKDVGGGRLIASVTDADGNVIGLIHDS